MTSPSNSAPSTADMRTAIAPDGPGARHHAPVTRATHPMDVAVGLRGRRLAACMVSAARDTTPSPEPRRGVDRVRLVEVMRAMADGDEAAVLRLHHEFFSPLAAVVRVELRRHHVHRIDNDDLNGLVLDVCFALSSCARAWDPDGALPWQWARPRVSSVVSSWVGQFAESFDPDRHGGVQATLAEPWTGHEPSMLELLDDLARRYPALALLREALALVGSVRDQELLIAYVAQQQAGDTSPAITLALTFDISPDAVRQAVSRMRRGLRQLAATDDRYEILDSLALVQ